jgi:inositol-polyphosphate multikinase
MSAIFQNVTNDKLKTRSSLCCFFCVGIAAFFDSGKAFQPALVSAFLRRLSVIESWFNSQTALQFFASSLLLVYDREALSSVDVPVAPIIPNGDHQSLADRNRTHVAGSTDADTLVSLENGSHLSTNSDSSRSIKEMSARNGLLCDRNTSPAESSTSHDDAWYDKHVDVRMIDFAHVFPSDTFDSNYLVGLHSLVSYFKQLTPTTYDP